MDNRIDLTDGRVFADEKIKNSSIVSEVTRLNVINTMEIIMYFEDIMYNITRDYEKLPYCITVINGNQITITNAVLDSNEYCHRCGGILIHNTGLCDRCKFEEKANNTKHRLFNHTYIPNMPRYFEAG